MHTFSYHLLLTPPHPSITGNLCGVGGTATKPRVAKRGDPRRRVASSPTLAARQAEGGRSRREQSARVRKPTAWGYRQLRRARMPRPARPRPVIRVPAALPLPHTLARASQQSHSGAAEPRRPASARSNEPASGPQRCFLTLLRFSVPKSTMFLDEFAAPTFRKNGEGTHLTPHGSSGEMAPTAGPGGRSQRLTLAQ